MRKRRRRPKMDPLTAVELRRFSRNYLRYEVEIFFGLRGFLLDYDSPEGHRLTTFGEQMTQFARLEAWCMHLRLLTNFLYDHRGEGTDPVAEDFVTNVKAWKQDRPTKTEELTSATNLISQHIAHLSYERRPGLRFAREHITASVAAALRVFVKHADPAKVDSFFLEEIQVLATPPFVDLSSAPRRPTIDEVRRLAKLL